MLNIPLLNNFFYLFIKNSFCLVVINSYKLPVYITRNVTAILMPLFEKLLLEYLYKKITIVTLNQNKFTVVLVLQMLPLFIM